MSGRIFSNIERAQFNRDGFLTVSDLAPAQDLEEVRAILDSLFRRTGRDHGVQDDMLKLAPQLKNSIVFQSCERLAKQLLGQSAAVSFDQALYKQPYEEHGTKWHQDQAFQGRFRPMNTVHFWIPLQPVTEENGCLHFIPGSHRLGLLPHYRFQASDPFSITTDHVEDDRAVPCPLMLCAATCHLPLTLHRALPNNTPSIRRAWALLFRPHGRFGFLAPSRIAGRIRDLVSHGAQ